MKLLLILGLLLITICFPARADTILTYENRVLTKIAEEATSLETPPKSWENLEKDRNEPIDQTFQKISPTKRYAFLPHPLKLIPPLNGELYIIARRPFPSTAELHSDYKSLGRFIVYRQDDKFKTQWINEEYIQILFKDHISILPTPDNEPLRPEEIEAKYGRHATTLGFAFLATMVLIGAIIFFFTDRLSPKSKLKTTNVA